MNNYYSQQGEDVYINNNYINKKVNKGNPIKIIIVVFIRFDLINYF